MLYQGDNGEFSWLVNVYGKARLLAMAIAFALRLAAKHHRDAESVIIPLIEH